VPRKVSSFFGAGDGRTLLLVDREVRLHDARGALVASAALPFAATITIGDRLVAAASTAGLVVLDKATLKERGRLAGWFTVTALEKALGPGRLLCERLGDGHTTRSQLRQILLLELASGGE
jgi:CBS domain-containing protein